MDILRELFLKGGPVMWPLLVCSLVSLTITVERVIFWTRERMRRRQRILDDVFDLTGDGRYDEAVSTGQRGRDACARVLVAGLTHRTHGLAEAMEVAAGVEVGRMKQGLSVLDTIITLAPLLGILGTVIGIIESFEMLGATGIEDPKAVTGGIAQALITTAAGLTIALASLVPFNTLVAAVQKQAQRLEQMATHFEVAYRKSMDSRAPGAEIPPAGPGTAATQ
jgi:biopolymer transport protein ExbB